MATNFTEKNISFIEINGNKYNLKSIPFHGSEVEWLNSNYIPKYGEIIIYDNDEVYNYPRFKTGDGVTKVSELPFSLATITEIQNYVNTQINSAGHLKRIVLAAGESLPEIQDAQIDTIYMKLAYDSRLAPDIYEEYMLINGSWEIIGNTKIDLTDYVTIEYLEGKGYLTEEQYQGIVKEIGAGVGLKISENGTEKPIVEIDESITFVLDCGTSEEYRNSTE